DEPAILADSIGALRFDLKKAVTKYNTYRPHHALKGRTPMEYLRITQAEAA
ncbi:MAG: transposase, partial [Verrucomicrobiaceae bacterium]|nr:transposase [Verrucomicrobiaceae bacterium]